MYIALGIFVFFLLLNAVVALLEKRMVWPYGPPQATPPLPDDSGYSFVWGNTALQSGFIFLGWSSDLKGPNYKVCYAFLVSPERDCLVIIGVGAILKMPIRGTWIYSRGADGKVFYTSDNQSCIEIDISKQWQSQLAAVSTFPELCQRHRDLLQKLRVTVQPFTVGREMEEFKHLREERFHIMSRQGLISFQKGSSTHWRYTIYGALKLTVTNHSIGLLRAITLGRFPRNI